MARWAVLILAVGLLFVTADGLSPYPEDYDLIEGASPGSERLRQGTALSDYLLNGGHCVATCNNQPLEEEQCRGITKVKCSGQNEVHGHNITTFSILLCHGRWSASGWNQSEPMPVSVDGEVVCNGAFHEKSIISIAENGSTAFAISEFGCAFMFSYEMTAMGGTMVDSSTCHGAAATKMLRSSKNNKTAVTREFMEALLDDVAHDDVDFVVIPDGEEESYAKSLSDRPEINVTCNDEQASPHENCQGTFKLDIKVGNVSIADECRGWWAPAPGEKDIAGCMGDWTMDVSGGHGELTGSCVGHVVLSVVHVDTPEHHFRGRRSLCVGRQDTSSQYAEEYDRQAFTPAIEKTTSPVIIS